MSSVGVLEDQSSSSRILDDNYEVLVLGLGLKGRVLYLGLGLEGRVLCLGLEGRVLCLGLEACVLDSITVD